jgi:NADH-quinone oxidoreductase subunit L
MLLAVGAIAAGWVGIPPLLHGGAHISHFLEPVLGHPHVHATHAQEWTIMGISVLIAVSGILCSSYIYLKRLDIPVRIARNFIPIYNLLFNKYYVDEIYSFLFVRPTLWVADHILVHITDAKFIEGIVNGVPKSIGDFSQSLRRIQTGVAQHYGIVMAAGAIFIIGFVLLIM